MQADAEWFKQRSFLIALVALLAVFATVIPIVASCHSGAASKEQAAQQGIEELSALVAASGGKPADSDLARIASKYAHTRAAALARFLRGLLSYSAQNYSAAVDAFDVKTISALTSLGDYALFYRAESYANSGASGEALRDYSAVYTKYPDSLMARTARLRACEIELALGNSEGAIRHLTPLIDSQDQDALYLAGRAYEQMGRSDQAIKLYRTIYYYRPASQAAEQAEARLGELGVSVAEATGSFDEERSRADSLFEAEQYAEAAKAYANLIARFPEAEQADKIKLRCGICLLNSKQTLQAIEYFAKVSERNPNLRAEALFYQADALRRLARPAQYALVVDRLLKQYPQSRWAHNALYNLASYLDRQGKVADSAARYRQLLSLYPKSEYAPEASYKLGWYAYQARNYAEAAQLLEKHLLDYYSPWSKFIGEAGLWAAKAEERLGKKARALALYEIIIQRYRYGYHGQIAAQRAARLSSTRQRVALIQNSPLSGSDLERIRQNALKVEKVEETAGESEMKRLSKVDDLEVIGLSEEAINELNRALESAPTSPLLNTRLARIYWRRGANLQATITLRRAYPDIYSYQDSDLPREVWEIYFPLRNWDVIKQEAKRYGIDPYIVAGLIRQESVFNPNAVSRVGARGLMQLMPNTAQLICMRQGGGRVTAADLTDPVINIKLGVNYLWQMLGEFGRIEYAAAAYNAGPARVRQWIRERGGMDIEDWIENIPLAETRGYVQGVLRYAANYRRFYKE
jgi:soluble lytic murein transglycosylase